MTTLPLSLFENGSDRFSSVLRGFPEIDSFFLRPTAASGTRQARPAIALDVEETAESYLVSVDLPGVKQDSVDVTLEGDKLTITVNVNEEKKSDGRNYLCKERWMGSAKRTIMLPAAASADDVDASLRDGVLSIIIKKPQQEIIKKIKIK